MARTETMTNKERLACALAGEKPDRTPVVPQLCMAAALNLSGYTQAEGHADYRIVHKAMLQTFEAYGGWDGLYIPMPEPIVEQQFTTMQPLVWLQPGKELDDNDIQQTVEKEIITYEDYERIIDDGWMNFYMNELPARIAKKTPDQVQEELKEFDNFVVNTCAPDWENKDVDPLVWDALPHPFFSLSLGRSLIKFTEDLYYKPEIIERVLPIINREIIERLLKTVEETGGKSILIGEERCSGMYYPMEIFEKYWWPYTVEIVDAMWSKGVVTVFHLDTDFGKNLPHWKQLPKGSYVLQLDSTTDIFAAKEAMGNHAIFYGDVPPAMQAIGTPEDIEGYVKKLIDEVGYEGGYILGVGCNVVPNCKPENFRAMIETGKKYELSK
jgi:uroporphyrinogen-III decarboxylase